MPPLAYMIVDALRAGATSASPVSLVETVRARNGHEPIFDPEITGWFDSELRRLGQSQQVRALATWDGPGADKDARFFEAGIGAEIDTIVARRVGVSRERIRQIRARYHMPTPPQSRVVRPRKVKKDLPIPVGLITPEDVCRVFGVSRGSLAYYISENAIQRYPHPHYVKRYLLSLKEIAALRERGKFHTNCPYTERRYR